MSYKRWDVYFALAPNFEDDKVLSRHPVMIWNDTTAFIVVCDMLTRPIEAGASCSREATLSDITGYPRVPRGSNDL